ncbi:MAG: single-stranded DNA-binding protein [Muribaculaceae bacterium]|nr:single-stranded DNA-binding protein [Muribaculaceae bacterium]MDE7110296.1 single-stranded DNA-binding protein [Muribaculaceae bacterium]
MSYQKVILIGNVGRDPQLRYEEQRAIASLPLATTETYANPAGGDPVRVTEWHRVVLLGAQAEFAEKYIRKGARLLIEGKLRTRTWEDRAALKHTVTEIITDKLEML